MILGEYAHDMILGYVKKLGGVGKREANSRLAINLLRSLVCPLYITSSPHRLCSSRILNLSWLSDGSPRHPSYHHYLSRRPLALTAPPALPEPPHRPLGGLSLEPESSP